MLTFNADNTRDSPLPHIEDILAELEDARLQRHLREANCGLEKEGLRVDHAGRLSLQPHPARLGSALTHEHITTDFSESLLELITPVFQDPAAALAHLENLHVFTQQGIGEELVWATSMPCQLPADDDIPIAEYGTSNSGLMRKIYRRGLAWRYGRTMQTIAGIHYNFSPPAAFWEAFQDQQQNLDHPDAFRNDLYLRLIRNFRRHVWLLVYLFGASPAVCESFLHGRRHELQAFTPHTLYLPWATSLRMSGLGYQNSAQSVVNVCYNTLDAYLASLRHATSTPHPPFTRIGVTVDGEYRQLNDNILQIENEYYSVIRPKRTVQRGERPLRALADRGVEYIEVRCLDINPYANLGTDLVQSQFLHVFLWYCLLADSSPIDDAECHRISGNLNTVVYRGREPGLQLQGAGGPVEREALGMELLDELEAVAEFMGQSGTSSWRESVRAMRSRMEDPGQTPSGRVVRDMRQRELSHLQFGLEASRNLGDWLRGRKLPDTLQREWNALAERSVEEQRSLEADTACIFERYLAHYFEQ